MAQRPGRFWPSNVWRQPVTVTGVDQIAAGVVGLVERAWARGMDGITGTIITGNSASPPYRYSGYVDYVTLANTTPVGASRNLRGDPNIALPGTNGPLIVSAAGNPSTSVMNQLAQMAPGMR